MEHQDFDELYDQFEEFAYTVARKVVAVTKEQVGAALTSDQYLIMRCIKKNKSRTSSQLAEMFYVNKSAITAIINRLCNKGYIQRIPDEHDRRVIHLHLTESGYEIVTQREERIRNTVGMYINQLDEDEIQAFVRTFKKLATIVNKNN